MKTKLTILAVSLAACTAFAQTNAVTAVDTATDALAGFLPGLAQNYPWIATVLLVVGALRLIFKPVMSLLDNYIKQNCAPDEYAKLQNFESGPIYKWLSFGLDLIGSVKLPVIGIKPGTQDQAKN